MTDNADSSLDRIFGAEPGRDIFARADASKKLYVRSVDQLAYASDRAKGRRLTAREALEAYGLDALREVEDEGSALLASDAKSAGRVLTERREQLGLTVAQVAYRSALTPEVLNALEASRRRPIQEYERAARVLGLDERMISYRSTPIGNERIAVRLRVLQHSSRSRLTPFSVAALAEASWVASTQMRLQARFRPFQPETTFEYDTDYGGTGRPAWREGFRLARLLRDRLSLSDDPIESLRDLCERRLNIPIIQAELGDEIAGATVDSDGARAIVLNLSGRNREVFVRRATLAHELGHILFDPPRRLEDLRVDNYYDLEHSADQVSDPVEQRANAFSVELIAPQHAAISLFESTSEDPLRLVMDHFGISYSAARYHVWNGLGRSRPLDSITTPNYPPDPSWSGREAYTVDYHPIRSLAQNPSRAGRFSALSLRAALDAHISWDTAAEWLMTKPADLQEASPEIRDLFPDVFS